MMPMRIFTYRIIIKQVRDLEYTFIDNASTTTVVVDAMGDVGRQNTILIDSLNNPHIVYHDTTNSALKVASLIDSAWIVSIVDNSSTFESSSAYSRFK